jgi:hypothetical protein
LWKSNLDKHFDGVEPCPICYSIVHSSDQSLPKIGCKQCKNKYHPQCLVRNLFRVNFFSTNGSQQVEIIHAQCAELSILLIKIIFSMKLFISIVDNDWIFPTNHCQLVTFLSKAMEVEIVEKSNGRKETKRKSIKLDAVQKLNTVRSFSSHSSEAPKPKLLTKSKSLRREPTLLKKTKTVLHPYQLLIDHLYQKQNEKIKVIGELKFKHDSTQELLSQGNSLLLFFVSDVNDPFCQVMLDDFHYYYRKLMFLNVNPILITTESQDKFNTSYNHKISSFHVIFDPSRTLNHFFNIKSNKIEVALLFDKEGVKNHIVVESGAARINFMSFFLHTDETGKKIDEFYTDNIKYSKKRRSNAMFEKQLLFDEEIDQMISTLQQTEILRNFQTQSPKMNLISMAKKNFEVFELSETVEEEEEEEKNRPIILTDENVTKMKIQDQNPLWKFASSEKLTLMLDTVDESLNKKLKKPSKFKSIFMKKESKPKEKKLEILGTTSNSVNNTPTTTTIGELDAEELKQMQEYADSIKELKEKFEYEQIYVSEKYFQAFKIFLSNEFALENALFIEHIREYKATPYRDRKKFVEEIQSKFFKEDSKYEINISNRSKSNISTCLHNRDFKDDLFDIIRKELKYGIMFDSFTRYIKTEAFVVMLVQGP